MLHVPNTGADWLQTKAGDWVANDRAPLAISSSGLGLRIRVLRGDTKPTALIPSVASLAPELLRLAVPSGWKMN